LNYREYIKSPEWKERSRRFIDKAGHRCHRCGASGRGIILQSHHRHYGTLGCEMPSDVEILCIGCHRKADAERRSGRPSMGTGV